MQALSVYPRSRKHATLRVDALPAASVTDPSVPPAVFLLDNSSFGTSLDGVRVPKGVWTPLPPCCELSFGTGGTAARLQHVPVLACCGALDDAAYEKAVAAASQLGAHLARGSWQTGCTHLLLPALSPPSVPADAGCACALYAGAPVVRASWLASGLEGATDAAATVEAYTLTLTHPSTGAPLVASTFPARLRGTLLRGVTLIFAPATTGGPACDHPLVPFLAPWDLTLAAAVKAAGGDAVALGEPTADEEARVAAAGGPSARGILLVLRLAHPAQLRRTAWARAACSEPARVLGTLLGGTLGTLQMPADEEGAAAAPPPLRGKAAAAQDDSGTDEDAPRATATQARKGTQAAPGFQSFGGGARAKREREEAVASGKPPPATAHPPAKKPPARKAAPKGGRNAALARALQLGKEQEAEEEEEDEPEADFYGDTVFEDLLVVAAPPGDVAAAHERAPQGFKRFRKVATLPSSVTSFALLVPYESGLGSFQAADPHAAQTAADKARDSEAAALFNAKNVKQQKAKAKPKAKAKKAAHSDSDSD